MVLERQYIRILNMIILVRDVGQMSYSVIGMFGIPKISGIETNIGLSV
jgi:hypothetical protein